MGKYIKAIKIHKIRHLENLEIPVSSDGGLRHLIITGKNGSGKTSLMEGMANYLFFAFFPEGGSQFIRNKTTIENILKGQDEIPPEKRELALKLIGKSDVTPTDVGEHFPQQDAQLITRLDRTVAWFQDNLLGLDLELDDPADLQRKIVNQTFLLSYLSAKRQAQFPQPNGITKLDLKQRHRIQNGPAAQFLQYIVNLKAQRSFARDKHEDKKVAEIDAWFQRFEEMLKQIYGDNELELDFDYENFLFNILLPHREPFDLNQLSDGFSAIIHIVSDLLLRAEANGMKAHEVEGVVLIDEIETHLHVELEKNILPFLCSFFPRIQFIVSTHSPFVLSSISNAVIYDLEIRESVEDLSGYSYSAIVEAFFNTNKYSSELNGKLREYENLVDRESHSSREKVRLQEIESYLDDIPKNINKELAIKYRELKLKRDTK